MSGSYIPYAYRWAVTQATPLGKLPLAVLVTLISYMDMKDKMCFPGRRIIASHVYQTEPAKVKDWMQDEIRKAVNILVANELILKDQDLRVNGSKSTNNYEILVPNFADVRHPGETQGTSPAEHRGTPAVNHL